MSALRSLWRPKGLLVAIILFQVLSLVARWLLITQPDWGQLALLLAFTLGVGAVLLWLPGEAVAWLQRGRQALVDNEALLILLLCLLVVVVGVVNANIQTINTDEEHCWLASLVVANEGIGPFFAKYDQFFWLRSQHPPLPPLIFGLAMRLFGVHLIVMRLVTVVMSAVTVVLAYLIGREVYDRESGLLGALFMVSLPLFQRLSVIPANDLPVIMFFALAVYLTLRMARNPSIILTIAIGLTIGAGLVSKYTMVFVYPILLACVFLIPDLRQRKLQIGVAVLISGAILGLWLLGAAQMGILEKQTETVGFLSGVTLKPTSGFGLASLARLKRRLDDLLTGLPNGLGGYNLPLLALGAWQLVRNRSRSDLFVLLWIVLVSVPIVVFLPVPRYLFLFAPALGLMMARALLPVRQIVDQVVLLSLLYSWQIMYLYATLSQPVNIGS